MSPPPQWLSTAVAHFGATCRDKLAGPGDREAAIRSPLEALLAQAGSEFGLTVVPHDEVRDVERGVRPDYAISVDGAITGYVEAKRPGHSIDPETFRGHDLRQWERQRDLPNLIYTNGTEWRLWRDGELALEPVALTGGPLEMAGPGLTAPAPFEALLAGFLRWEPSPITNVSGLVRAIAPLTRLLRGEVLDQLAIEERNIAAGKDPHRQPFRGLASDWRKLLFPEADDARFADGYAQTVTFALLLARSEGIDLSATTLHEVGSRLGEDHSLMGRALQLLTDEAAQDFKVTLDLLLRVVSAVRWDRIRKGRRDTYLYLYEEFLDVYDAELRKASGSYYTPLPLVQEMTRLAEDALEIRLARPDGFLDPHVLTIDPAMGTGTYLSAIIDRVAERAVNRDGPGIAAGVVSDLAKRLVGFEIQLGPYAVAELRSSDLLKRYAATPPRGGMQTYVTNTLDDPYTDIDQIASGLQVISDSRRMANKIKGTTPVTVVIGNPPYRERAQDQGGWIEHGRASRGKGTPKHVPLDDFRAPDNGRTEYVLKNLYVYFWRWATWKVFDAHPEDSVGIVCFVTTSGYVQGRGFAGMREYLRRTCSEGWIINLSPEGHRPDVATRVFPGVQQTLAIGLFVRDEATDRDAPAIVHYREVSGRRAEKYEQLREIRLDDDGWRLARTAWHSSLTPAPEGSAWDLWPALDDVMPWFAPGVKANRTWVYAPDSSILERRWQQLVTEKDPARRQSLFETKDPKVMQAGKKPLPGPDTHTYVGGFNAEHGPPPDPVRVGFRAFDRQWLIPDARLINRERPALWSARVPDQVYVIEQSAHPIEAGGPALAFSALIPDMHYFNNRGGRTLPMLHPDLTPNLAPGLLDTLAAQLGVDVTALDLVSYLAGVTAHPAFTETFEDELSTPGVRVPFTTDPVLWQRAIELGRIALWLHTYGVIAADDNAGRPAGNVRYPKGDDRQPLSRNPVTMMPASIEYDEMSQTLRLGDGNWSPVSPAVRAYEVGNRNVIDSWFNYRKAEPGGRHTATTSALASIHTESWPVEWTVELIDLLTVLSRLVELEFDQAEVLKAILASPALSATDLASQGVRWPIERKHRLVRLPALVGGGLPDVDDDAV